MTIQDRNSENTNRKKLTNIEVSYSDDGTIETIYANLERADNTEDNEVYNFVEGTVLNAENMKLIARGYCAPSLNDEWIEGEVLQSIFTIKTLDPVSVNCSSHSTYLTVTATYNSNTSSVTVNVLPSSSISNLTGSGTKDLAFTIVLTSLETGLTICSKSGNIRYQYTSENQVD